LLSLFNKTAIKIFEKYGELILNDLIDVDRNKLYKIIGNIFFFEKSKDLSSEIIKKILNKIKSDKINDYNVRMYANIAHINNELAIYLKEIASVLISELKTDIYNKNEKNVMRNEQIGRALVCFTSIPELNDYLYKQNLSGTAFDLINKLKDSQKSLFELQLDIFSDHYMLLPSYLSIIILLINKSNNENIDENKNSKYNLNKIFEIKKEKDFLINSKKKFYYNDPNDILNKVFLQGGDRSLIFSIFSLTKMKEKYFFFNNYFSLGILFF
jgi:hypothetical protein